MILFIVIIFTGSAYGREWGVVDKGDWLLKAPADYPEANAVIILDSGSIGYVNQNTKDIEDILVGVYGHLVYLRHVRIKVLKKAGAEEVGDVQFRFLKDEELGGIKAHTMHSDGSIDEVKKEDFFVKKINDIRYMTFSFPSVDSGDIVEYVYSIVLSKLISSYEWYFQNPVYTLESKFSFDVPRNAQYTYFTRNVPEYNKKPLKLVFNEGTFQEYVTYNWNLTRLHPARQEPFMSCLSNYVAHLTINLSAFKNYFYQYEFAKTWQELGLGFNDIFQSYCRKPRGFRQMVKKLVKGVDSKYEISKVIYNHIINEIQTRQDKFSFGSFHDKMSETLEERHATSAEKNLLLVEMLKQAGVKAWPVLISTRDNGIIDPQLMDVEQFNHIIAFAEVEQGGIYLDATSQYCPYGILPPVCRTNAGLLIDGYNSELMKIITAQPKSNRVEVVRIQIDPQGGAEFSIQSKFTGYLAAEFGMKYEAKEPDDFIKDDFLSCSDFDFKVGEYNCLMDSANRFTVETAVSAENFAALLDDNVSIIPPCFMFNSNPFKEEQRQFPVDFNYPFTYHNIVQINLADSVTSYTFPEDVRYVIDGASYTRQTRFTQLGASIERKLEIEKPIYNVEEYPDVREFFRVVAEANHEPLIFQVKKI